MNNRLVIILTVIVLFAISTSCVVTEPTVEPPIEMPTDEADESELFRLCEDIGNCFRKLHNNAVEEIELEIADLDEQITIIQNKSSALNQMKTQIDDAITYLGEGVAEEKLETGGYWYFILPEDEYHLFETEYYEISEFELHWWARVKEEKWELTTKQIMVRDKETGKDGPPEILLNELQYSHTVLTSNQNSLTQMKEERAEILVSVIDNSDLWEIKETSSMVYLVHGYGLGYEDQLVIGEWYYYLDSDSIQPKSSSAEKLKDVLVFEGN